MKRKRAAAFLGWLLPELIFLMITFWNSSIFGMVSAVAWLVLPVISAALNLYTRKHLSIKVMVPVTASKKIRTEGKIEIRNQAVLPVGRIFCRLCMENRLTGEKQEGWLELSAAAKGKTQAVFQIESGYCGYIYAEVQEVFLMDWFGFLAVRKKTDGKGKISILPDTFAANLSVGISYVNAQDTDTWSPNIKGNDYSEVFALREYVQGDSLKQIHWKLSSKLNQLIVKEPSLPIEKSLLLFWDKNTALATPGEMDAMAEVVSSVGQALTDQGIWFTLGWTEGRANVFEDVNGEDELLQFIPRMVKVGALQTADAEMEGEDSPDLGISYGKVLYFARRMPEYAFPFSFADMTAVLCGTQEVESEWKTLVYSPETYMEDLQAAEL